jgi:uncharacterized coiled-coil DUF342 family protein
MLTPEQFNILATKDDLQELERKLKTDFANKEDVSSIVSAIDSLAKMVKDFQAELASNQNAHDRIDSEIITLKTRVTSLETA